MLLKNEFLTFRTVNSNALEVSLTKKGKNEFKRLKLIETIDGQEFFNEDKIDLLMDGIEGLIFHFNLGESGFGMTSAPGFVYEDDEVWYFNDYAIRSFVEDLNTNNKAIFHYAN